MPRPMAPTTTRSKNLVRASRYSRIRPAAGPPPAPHAPGQRLVGGGIAVRGRDPGESEAVRGHAPGRDRRAAASQVRSLRHRAILARAPTCGRGPRPGVWQFGYMTTDPTHRSVRLERIEN